ncbi:argonaute-2-like isoform X3, partial [Paramuricea clavata]
MSDQGQGGKKGKGRGRKRGKGRGGQQQRQSESVPGGLQQQTGEQQGATALPEQRQPQQGRQQSQKQPQRKQQPSDEQQGVTALPEQRQPPREKQQQPQQGRQQSQKQPQRKQQPSDEQQGATALPEQRQPPKGTQQQPQQGRQQSLKQPQIKQQPRTQQQPQQGRQQSLKQPQIKQQPSNEQQGVTALPEQGQSPKETQQQSKQGRKQSQKQPQRKQHPSDEQQGVTTLPEQRQPPKGTQQQPQQGRQQSLKQPQIKQQPSNEQQGVTALPEQGQSPKETQQQSKQGRKQSQKQPQRKQHPSDEQQGVTTLPEQRQPPKGTQQQPQQGRQQSLKQPQIKQQPSNEQQGVTALPEQGQSPKETQQQSKQGRKQSQKQPQRKQHPSDEQQGVTTLPEQRQPPKGTQQQPQQGRQQSLKQPQIKQQPSNEQQGVTALPEQGQSPKETQQQSKQGVTALPEQRQPPKEKQQQPQQGRQQSLKQPQIKQQPSNEQQGVTALPEQGQPPKETQQQSKQGRKQSQKQPQRKQHPSDEQQGATALPEQRQPPKGTQQQPQQGRQQSQKQPQRKQHPSDEQQGATALPEQRQPPKETQQQSQKQPQRKQQPGDRTDGAGPSKPPGQPSPASQGDSRPQGPAQPRAQPSTQPSAGAAKPAPPQQPQSPRGAEKPDSSGQRGSTPQSDRARPKPPRRPDGGGRSGRSIQIRANFLPVKIPTSDIHHYKTGIQEKGNKSGEGYTKAEAQKIIQEVVKIYEKENPSGPKVVYDKNGENMYCPTMIPGIGIKESESRKYDLQYTTDNGSKKEFIVNVRYVARISLSHLNEVLEGQHTEIPFDTTQAIQIVVKLRQKMRTIQVRNSFFDYPTGCEKDLGGGVQVWNGTFVSIRPTQWKMMLNVDTCATSFYKGQSVLDFMCEFLDLQNLPRRLDEKQRKKFAKEIKAIKVETTHMNRKQKASGLSFKSAKDETFDCEGRKVSVLNYFRDKYKITLQHPDLPCIKIGQKGSLIPIELCRVVDGQKKRGKLTGAQKKQMIRHTTIPAPDRMQKITELIRKLRYESDPYCQDFCISIDNEMVTIQGRVLDPPLLMYGPGNRLGKEMPHDGTWKNTKQMLDPKELKEWAVVAYINDNIQPKRGGGGGRYSGPEYLDDRGVNNLIDHLVDVGRKKGVRVNENPCYVGTETGFRGTDKLFGDLKARYPNLQLIVVVLPVSGDDYYEEVKHCGDVVHGITTQCIKVEQASSDFSDWRKRETLVNLWLKINAKLGGTTCILDWGVKSPIFHRPVIIF